MRLTLQRLEVHLWGAANVLRGWTAGQDCRNSILSLAPPRPGPGIGTAARRLTLAGLLVLLLALPLAVEALQARVDHVGVILRGDPSVAAVDGLRDGLREPGLEEGKQFVLRARTVNDDPTSVEAARGLEAEKVDLIVFYAGTDPLSVGLVESFRRPGGPLTGKYAQSTDLTAKRRELPEELVPGLRRVVTLYRPDNPSPRHSVRMARDAARRLEPEIVERPVGSREALRARLRALRPGEADAVFLASDALVSSQPELIVEVARANRLPTMFQEPERVPRGALAGYGEGFHPMGRLSARHVQRVLLGAQPGDLPVEQADRLHFVINLGTAKALCLTIPPSLLTRADEAIQ